MTGELPHCIKDREKKQYTAEIYNKKKSLSKGAGFLDRSLFLHKSCITVCELTTRVFFNPVSSSQFYGEGNL